MGQPLIVLTGPTAVGKTALSIKLAKAIKGEVISADSMQVYKGMDIGTAKITEEEMEKVPHHLIDIFEPNVAFNVHTFQTLAKTAIEDIYNRNKVPIMVGGTGFYIQSVLYNIDFNEETAMDYRKELERLATEKGVQYLHQRLEAIDPVSAKKIHANNVKRVIRAIEYFMQNNEPISKHNEEQQQKESAYNSIYYVLTMDREILYERINKRVDLMIEQGLVEEVRGLKEKGYSKELVSMQGIGYKEIYNYLEGTWSLDEAISILKRDTRHFAKRQLTWFKREKDVKWIDVSEYNFNPDLILNKILQDIEEKGII